MSKIQPQPQPPQPPPCHLLGVGHPQMCFASVTCSYPDGWFFVVCPEIAALEDSLVAHLEQPHPHAPILVGVPLLARGAMARKISVRIAYLKAAGCVDFVVNPPLLVSTESGVSMAVCCWRCHCTEQCCFAPVLRCEQLCQRLRSSCSLPGSSLAISSILRSTAIP